MTAVPLLDHHHGDHCAPRVSIFRRLVAAWRRKRAPEAAPPASGAAALIDVPPGWRADARGVLIPPVPAHRSTQRVYVGGRNLGTMPRRWTPDRPPWNTAAFPVYGEAAQDRVDEAQRLAEVMLP